MDNPLADNRLAYIDQGSFLALRALGHEPLQQFIWLYDHDVDIDRLRQLHHNLGYTLLGRRIERSPLPFGRHRWVTAHEQSPLDVSAPRPRAEFQAWLDEKATARPIDPEQGPAWRMAVVPFTDGGAGLTLIASHSVGDVGAMLLSLVYASMGKKLDLGYPQPGSRVRKEAIREDLADTMRAVPEMGRAIRAGAAVAREAKGESSSVRSRPRRLRKRSDTSTVIRPSVAAFVPIDEWDRRAKELEGNAGAFVAGFAARLGMLRGRVEPDGLVTLQYPVGDRGEGDVRANALTGMTVRVDPREVVHSLAAVRAEIKSELTKLAEAQNALMAPLPLAPVTPRRLVKRLEKLALGEGRPVGCSNLGDMPPPVGQPDGTAAEYFWARGVEWPIGRETLDGIGGSLFLGSGRILGKVILAVTAWQVGTDNSIADLKRLVEQGLDDFGLSGTFV